MSEVHSHPHDHPHPHVEAPPQPSEVGSVVLDIGGSIGALNVVAPDELSGVELEIRPVGAEWDGTHVAIVPRILPGQTIHTALFPSLAEGPYEIRRRDDGQPGVVLTADVLGGRVVNTEWV